MSASGIDRTRDRELNGRTLEIAHVLFMDIVSFSVLPMDLQTEAIRELQRIVLDAPEFQQVQTRHELICLPTGDGMALFFFGDPGIVRRHAAAGGQ